MKDIHIPLRSFIAEHKKLIRILKEGSKKQQIKESKEQMKELIQNLKKK